MYFIMGADGLTQFCGPSSCIRASGIPAISPEQSYARRDPLRGAIALFLGIIYIVCGSFFCKIPRKSSRWAQAQYPAEIKMADLLEPIRIGGVFLLISAFASLSM